jgi:formate hydrogenlyase subunit 6/NADH:ubiquinone oxidoreductase subunit I
MLTIALNQGTCTGCQLCVVVCPSLCFAMDWAAKKAVVVDEAGCIACLNCEDICAPDALEIQIDERPFPVDGPPLPIGGGIR